MENRKAAIEWFSMLKKKFVKTEYEGYLDMAISALEKQEQDRWIPVTERLPEEETDVLICNADGEIAISRGSMSTESTESWIWYTSGWRFGNVTAWRPLPAPYQEDEA